MTQPILLVLPHLTDEQLANLKVSASGYQVISRNQLTETINWDHVEILFGWNQDIGQRLLDSPTSNLRWIQAYSAGVDYLDLQVLQDKHILLTNASGVHATPITESVIGMLLSHYRHIREAILLQNKKEWNSKLPSSELSGKNMMIVGTGQIGQHLAQVSQMLGLTVFGISRSGHPLDHFQEVYAQSRIEEQISRMDIVVNILPLTAETHHFYDDRLFAKMKDNVVFINVGRGPSVDTEALIRHCQSGKISFAGLDVFEEEPLPPTSQLWELDNVLLTPHISGNTDQYDQRLLAILSDNLDSFKTDGTLQRNLVNLTLGY